jgi:hypothetical protein
MVWFGEARIMNALTVIAWISLSIAIAAAIVITVDEIRHPQKMWIMNIVWPVTALYLSLFALWGYYQIGRGMAKDGMRGVSAERMQKHQEEQAGHDPTWRQTAVADTHCGAGCAVGDIIAEFSLFALGWTFFSKSLYAEFVGDLLLGWLFGIAFQYFTIKPMRNLTAREGMTAAIKSDTLAILTFEVGLFAWMALVYFVFFPNPHLSPIEPGFWFMMQIGMIIGFLTSYPMNRWLITADWKAVMG